MILRVPTGWSASEEGYFLNTEALQYLVADAESWEKTATAWEEAYDELRQRYTDYVGESRRRLESLRETIDKERASWKAAVRRERTKPGLGVYAGYGTSGFSVGLGLVWRVM